jgi:hypothetical protein
VWDPAIFYRELEIALGERISPKPYYMDRETQSAAELQSLRVLCDEATPREERTILTQSLSQHAFIEPEHEVVFESIRALSPRGPMSVTQLRVHLNNRGFPDTDVEKYFQTVRSEHIAPRSTDKATR